MESSESMGTYCNEIAKYKGHFVVMKQITAVLTKCICFNILCRLKKTTIFALIFRSLHPMVFI